MKLIQNCASAWLSLKCFASWGPTISIILFFNLLLPFKNNVFHFWWLKVATLLTGTVFTLVHWFLFADLGWHKKCYLWWFILLKWCIIKTILSIHTHTNGLKQSHKQPVLSFDLGSLGLPLSAVLALCSCPGLTLTLHKVGDGTSVSLISLKLRKGVVRLWAQMREQVLFNSGKVSKCQDSLLLNGKSRWVLQGAICHPLHAHSSHTWWQNLALRSFVLHQNIF